MALHNNLRLMKWFNFFSDFRPYSPIAIVYFSQVTGSFASGLLIFSIFSIAISAFEIPTGIYSDRNGRRKTLILGAVASVLSLACYAIGGTFWMLALGAVLAGLQESFFSGNNDALIYESLAETSEQDAFHEHLGNINSMFQVGLGTSALLASLFAGISLSLVFWISIIPQVIALLIGLRLTEPKVRFSRQSGNVYAHLKDALVAFRDNHKLRDLSLSSILKFGMGEVSHQFTPAFIITVWPVWALGIYRCLCNLFAFLGSRGSGRILRRFSSFKVLIAGQVLSVAIDIGAVAYPGVWSPILISITSVSFGLSLVALSALMHKEFGDRQRATMGSVNSLLGNVFFAVFAYAFGFVADRLGTSGPIIITNLLMLTVVYLYWRMFKNHRSELLNPV